MKQNNKTSNPAFQLNGMRNHLPRTAFPLDHREYFTKPLGLLTPLNPTELLPGDYIKGSINSFVRTSPCQTAAFVRLNNNLDLFNVPIKCLWRYFPDFVTQMQDFESGYNIAGSSIPKVIPTCNFAQLAILLNQSNLKTNDSDSVLTYDSDGKYVDCFGYDCCETFLRVLDFLGYPVVAGSVSKTIVMYQSSNFSSRRVNIFRLLAFNYIWYHYYRPSDYIANEPKAFNIDDCTYGVSSGSTPSASSGGQNYVPYSTISTSRLIYLLKPLQYLYKLGQKDISNSFKPSNYYNPGLNSASLTPYVQGSYVTAALTSSGVNMPNSYEVQSGDDGDLVDTNLNVSQLRQLYAVDRLSRVMMLNPKYADEQIAARYGINTPKISKDECSIFIKGYNQSIGVSEVTATSSGTNDNGDTNVLGEISGKGYSTNTDPQAFEFENGINHSIMLGVHYISMANDYDSTYLDKNNAHIGFCDFYQPEYADLGLQPLEVDDISFLPQFQADNTVTSMATPHTVLGYSSRYYEYKTKRNIAHGLFQSSGSLADWVASRNKSLTASLLKYNGAYVTLLFQNPAQCNQLFTLSYDGTQLTDPFWAHYRLDMTKVSNMSQNGIS